MKKLLAISLLTFCSMITSCKKDDEETPTNNKSYVGTWDLFRSCDECGSSSWQCSNVSSVSQEGIILGSDFTFTDISYGGTHTNGTYTDVNDTIKITVNSATTNYTYEISNDTLTAYYPDDLCVGKEIKLLFVKQ